MVPLQIIRSFFSADSVLDAFSSSSMSIIRIFCFRHHQHQHQNRKQYVECMFYTLMAVRCFTFAFFSRTLVVIGGGGGSGGCAASAFFAFSFTLQYTIDILRCF